MHWVKRIDSRALASGAFNGGLLLAVLVLAALLSGCGVVPQATPRVEPVQPAPLAPANISVTVKCGYDDIPPRLLARSAPVRNPQAGESWRSYGVAMRGRARAERGDRHALIDDIHERITDCEGAAIEQIIRHPSRKPVTVANS